MKREIIDPAGLSDTAADVAPDSGVPFARGHAERLPFDVRCASLATTRHSLSPAPVMSARPLTSRVSTAQISHECGGEHPFGRNPPGNDAPASARRRRGCRARLWIWCVLRQYRTLNSFRAGAERCFRADRSARAISRPGRAVFANLKIAVEAAGGMMADIVKLNYYLAAEVDQADVRKLRPIRDRYINIAIRRPVHSLPSPPDAAGLDDRDRGGRRDPGRSDGRGGQFPKPELDSFAEMPSEATPRLDPSHGAIKIPGPCVRPGNSRQCGIRPPWS